VRGEFFLRRPVFAAVCSILIVLSGLVSLLRLPVEWYPNLAPPQVQVTANYLGASAETVEDTVTTPLEQAINGVEGMRWMTSSSTNSGQASITVTFELARDGDLATVDVQNAVSKVLPALPQGVRDLGVQVNEATNTFVFGMALFSSTGEYDSIWLSNYADRVIRDRIKRVPGVADVRIFGERKYAMRVWLDPLALAARGMTAEDVVVALERQNLQLGAGQVGAPPVEMGQTVQLGIQSTGRLGSAEEFEQVVVSTTPDGRLVRLRDVGRAELGAENYATFFRFSGKPAVGLGIVQLQNANALETKRQVIAVMEELKREFPPTLDYAVGFDSTVVIEESIREVVWTLVEAIALVVLVIFAFLGSFRSTLIPAIAIPISLVGTFFFADVMGFSLNTLTLFGLTLATGLVVDDAIVVLENVERILAEEDVSPYEAARRSMGEIFGAVIAMTLVTCAVFVPVAFFPGTTGVLYQQFALTIVFSVGLSAFVSLTLTPALCAMVLRKRHAPTRLSQQIDRIEGRLRAGYLRALSFTLRRWRLTLAGLGALLVASVVAYRAMPTGFIPSDDQGYLIVSVQGPPGASLEQTSAAMAAAEAILLEQPEVKGTFVVGGFNFGGNAANRGTIFVPLKPFDERRGAGHDAAAVVERVRGPMARIVDAVVVPFMPPAIRGLGSVGGLQLQLLDLAGQSPAALAAQSQELIQAASQRPELTRVFAAFTADDPQLFVDVDRERAEVLGVGVDTVLRTLSTLLGSRYVNDFTLDGRSYRVYVQAEGSFRQAPEQIPELYVRGRERALVPLGSVAEVRETFGPPIINHYNLSRSVEVNGAPAAGRASGEAIATMEAVAQQVLAPGFGLEWTGLTLEEIDSGGTALLLLGLGALVVLLVLAAQFESFILPVVVMLTVPPAALGAIALQWSRGMSNDVFAQIGLVMLVGLGSKNAILIVEFAKQLREQGRTPFEAAIQAAGLRLRPILMTALSFVIGLLPLLVASGASAMSRRSLGNVVFGGMLMSVVVTLLVTPVLYMAVEQLRTRLAARGRSAAPPAET
jgi:HAE1 family hydrophobic/amphiphilic exporter-1